MFVKREVRLTDISQSIASGLTSGTWDLEGVEKGAIEISWANVTGEGTLKIQVMATGASWFDLDGFLRPITGASGNILLPITIPIVFSKARLVVTQGTLSAGTLTAVAIGYIARIDNQPIRDF